MAMFNSFLYVYQRVSQNHRRIDEKMDVSTGSSRSSSARLPCSGGENKGATGGAIRIVFDLQGAAFWTESIQIGWVPLQFPTLKWKTNMNLEGTQEIQLPLLPSYPHDCFSFSPSYPRQMICICKSFWVFRMWMHWMANKNGGKQPLGYQGMLHPNAGFPWVWCYPVLQTFELHISYQNKSEKMVTKTFKPVFFLWYPILTHTYSNQSSRVRNQGHVFWTRNSVPSRILNPTYNLAKWNTIT